MIPGAIGTGRYFIVGLLFLLPTTPAAAQAPDPCSYSSCGLMRVGHDVLAGQQREEVASFGHFSPPDLHQLFESSDSATHQLTVAEANYGSGKGLSLLGFALTVGGIVALDIIDESGSSPAGREWVALGVSLTGVGLTLWGDRRVSRALRAVDEGIWWYNANLRR